MHGLLANDSDPNGKTLTAVLNTGPSSGSLSLHADGSFTYTPNHNFLGTDSFTYFASDGTGETLATATIDVTPPAPIVVPQSYSVGHDRLLIVDATHGLLAGDSNTDPDGGPLVVNGVLSQPQNGTVTVDSTGSFTYQPNGHFFGPDSFTYFVADGFIETLATANITVTEQAPAVVAESYDAVNNAILRVDAAHGLLLNDSDPDGDALFVNGVQNQPKNGTVTVNTDGSFTYLPNAHSSGPDSFTYFVSDGLIATLATATINVSPVRHFHVIKGYISGATVFADANGNGQLDAGEASAMTDTSGGFTLTGGSGPLIALGGTDTSTGLQFRGELTAPADSTVVTPLTTLLNDLPSDPAAQPKILAALGLSPSLDLETLDPIAAAKAGDLAGAAAEVAAAKIYDTVSLIASTLSGVGANFMTAVQDSFAALAAAIEGAVLDLGNTSAVTALVNSVAQTEHVTLPPGAAVDLASVIAAGNSALDHVVNTDQTCDALLADTTAIELIMQGAGSSAFAQAAANPASLPATTGLFMGANLANLITQAQQQVQNPGQSVGPVAFNGSGSTDEDTVLSGSVAAIDLNGDSVSYALNGTAPAGLSFHPDGTFSFDPRTAFDYLAAGETASVSFQFTATDGQTLSNVATETITISGRNDPPGIDAAHSKVAGTVTELPLTTGSPTIDKAAGTIAFSDPDTTDRPTATIDTANQTIAYTDSGGHSRGLTPSQISAIEDGFHFAVEPGNTNSGQVDWSYSVADSALDFLGAGETVALTTPVVIDDHHGGTVTQDVTIRIVGANDNPQATADSNGVARGASLAVSATKGVLANDSDPDIHDHLAVGAADGMAANVGHAIKGAYGSLTLDSDGSYVYTANNGSLPSQIVAQDKFTYTVSDGHGGTDTSTLTIVVSDPGTRYLSGENTILVGGNGKNVLDGSGGHDVLIGSNGPDVLIGGGGDVLTGGHGADTFVFRPNFGLNTITDFDVHNDVIQFDKSIFHSVSDVLAHLSDSCGGALITDGRGDSITFQDVTAAQLVKHSDAFHLV